MAGSLSPQDILPALKGFQTRYGAQSPESFAHPTQYDTDQFREYAIRNHCPWYPFQSQPFIKNLETIYATLKDYTPLIMNIVMIAILEDTLHQEGDIYDAFVAPIEIIRFFRERGYKHGRFICEGEALLQLRDDASAAEPAPPSPPALPALPFELPPLTESDRSPSNHRRGLPIPHYKWLTEQLGKIKKEASELDRHRSELQMRIRMIEAYFAAAELGLPM